MKILAYNEDGSFNGWYESSIHSTIPEPNIEVPEIVYRQLSSQQRIGQVITVVDGKAELSSPADRVLTWDDIKRQRDGPSMPRSPRISKKLGKYIAKLCGIFRRLIQMWLMLCGQPHRQQVEVTDELYCKQG